MGIKIKLAATNGSERDSPPDKVEEVDLLVTSLTVIMPPPVFFAVSVNLNRHVFTSQETLIDLGVMICEPQCFPALILEYTQQSNTLNSTHQFNSKDSKVSNGCVR